MATRRQHWLPRASYLKHFTKDGKITVYQFKDGDKANFLTTAKKFSVTPENIAHKRDLYETPALPENTIENIFATIESEYGRVLENKILQKKRLYPKDREVIALYISSLENRTPMQQAHVNKFLSDIEATGRAGALAHNAPEAVEDWSRQIEDAKKEFFAQWLAVTLDVNKWGVLDYCFLEIADYVDADFIAGDHPVTLTDFTADNSPYGLNQWHKTAECIVPLTPRLALFGNNCGIKGYKEVDYNFVREINHRTLRRADKMILSAGDVIEYEAKAMVQHMPQSLLLNFVKLPKGRTDRIIAESKKREAEGQ